MGNFVEKAGPVTTPWLAIFAWLHWNPQDFFNSEDAKEEDLRKQFEGRGEKEAAGKHRYINLKSVWAHMGRMVSSELNFIQ